MGAVEPVVPRQRPVLSVPIASSLCAPTSVILKSSQVPEPTCCPACTTPVPHCPHPPPPSCRLLHPLQCCSDAPSSRKPSPPSCSQVSVASCALKCTPFCLLGTSAAHEHWPCPSAERALPSCWYQPEHFPLGPAVSPGAVLRPAFPCESLECCAETPGTFSEPGQVGA